MSNPVSGCFLSLWRRSIDGFLCRSPLFLHGRGPTALGFLRRKAETSSTAWQLMSQATKGSMTCSQLKTSPSPFQVMKAGIQAGTLPVEERSSLRKSRPLWEVRWHLCLGQWPIWEEKILVPLWTQGNFCSFPEKLQLLRSGGKLHL